MSASEFDGFKRGIEANGPGRDEIISRFVHHYLRPENDALRQMARRAFFEQLRPVYSIEDVVSRVGEKLERRLRDRKLRLETEKQFLSYVNRMIKLTLLDLDRLRRDPPKLAEPLGDAGGIDVAQGGKGPATEARDADAASRLREVLRELLQADEWHLIRRHYFEEATYAEIADEVLPPPEGPLSPEQARSRSDIIRMRIQRIRDELAKKEDDLLGFLSK